MRWAKWLVGLAIAVVCLWAITPPYDGHSKQSAIKTQCLSNLKQLGTATTIYAGDFDDRMPPERWAEALTSTLNIPDMFGCPTTFRVKPQTGFAYKLGLAAARLSSVQDPEHTVLFFETEALAHDVVANLAARCERHDRGGSNVVYADGHGKYENMNAVLK